MTVTPGQYGRNDASGWTTITVSGGGTTFYVSDSGGNVANNGLSSVDNPTGAGGVGPKKTIAQGVALLNTAGNGDHQLLLKKGDTFHNQQIDASITVNGLDSNRPILIGAYGSGARPIVEVDPTQQSGIGSNTSGCNNLAVIGLDFYAYARDPANVLFNSSAAANQGVRFLAPFTWLLIEDCKFSFFQQNVVVDTAFPGTSSNFTFRRNICVDSWFDEQRSSHSSGLHTQFITSGAVVEENVLDHNGWNETLIAPASVTITQATPAVVTWAGNVLYNGAVITFASSGGGITAGTFYYVVSYGVDGVGKFRISLSSGGAAIATSVGLVSPQNAAWNAPEASPAGNTFNHNMYFDAGNGPITLRGNISARGSSVGFQVRPGGIVYDNLVVNNSFGGFVARSRASTMTYNVCLQGKDVNTVDAGGGGLQIAAGSDNVVMQNNIIAHRSASAGYAIDISPTSESAVTISIANPAVVTTPSIKVFPGNAVKFSTTGALPTGITAGTLYYVLVAGFDDTSVAAGCNFRISATPGGAAIVTSGSQSGVHTIEWEVLNAFVTNNIIYDWGTSPGNFTDTGISSIITPNTNLASGGSFTDSARSVGSYNGTLGGPTTLSAFLTEARLQSKDNWRPQFTANAVNNYIRAGFDMAAIGGNIPTTILMPQACV